MIKFLVSCLIVISCLTSHGTILHSERSLYRNITVDQLENKRCMVFGRLSRYPDYQSCIDSNNPDFLVFSYTKLVMSGLAVINEPKSVLIIGLGGGTLPLSIANIYPNSEIDTVEIDEAVVRVAKQWFDYKETNKQKVYLLDGRVFVKRQLRKQKKYDLIILDAFNGDYIPEHLMTQEFLNEIKQLLSVNGLLIANTFTKNKLYHHESVTYQNVFGQFHFIHSQKSGNRIIFARPEQSIETSIIANSTLANKLTRIGVNLDEFNNLLENKPNWDESVRPLTDQYSPANLLNQ